MNKIFFVLLILEGAGYFLFNGILKIPADRIDVGKIIFQFMLVSTFVTIISVPYDAIINAHENMFLVAILGIIEAILKLVIAIFVTQTSFDKLISYGVLMALLSILLLIIRRIYCHSKYDEAKINLKKYYSKPLFKEMTRFAGWSFLGSSSSMIANYGQSIIINIFFGTAVNAAQGVSNQVSGQLGAFAGTMMKALNPLIAKSEGAGNRTLMIEAVMTGSKISFFLLTFFFIPILIEMPYIFDLWLKNVPEFAVIFCELLLIRNLIEQLFVTLASSISAQGNIKKYEIISSVLCFFPIIISYIFFYLGYPAYFIYIIFIIYSILASGVILFFTWHNYKFPVYIFLKNVVFRSVITFLIIFFASYCPALFIEQGLLRLFLVLAISSLIFPVAIWFIGFNANERDQSKKLIRPILSKIYSSNFHQ